MTARVKPRRSTVGRWDIDYKPTRDGYPRWHAVPCAFGRWLTWAQASREAAERNAENKRSAPSVVRVRRGQP